MTEYGDIGPNIFSRFVLLKCTEAANFGLSVGSKYTVQYMYV